MLIIECFICLFLGQINNINNLKNASHFHLQHLIQKYTFSVFFSVFAGNKLNTYISVKHPQLLHLLHWCRIKQFYFSHSDARCSWTPSSLWLLRQGRRRSLSTRRRQKRVCGSSGAAGSTSQPEASAALWRLHIPAARLDVKLTRTRR